MIEYSKKVKGFNTMNKKLVNFFLIGLICNIQIFANDDQILLNAFHEYGITKCDSFILKNSKLKENWNYFISKHNRLIDKKIKNVSIVEIFGTKNDTVKLDHDYIESPNGCFVTKNSSLTFNGSCADNIDGNDWYVSTTMADKDYTTYKNKNGVLLHAKEITMGNFKACLQEISIKDSVPLEK